MKVTVIGLGVMGQNHARVLAKLGAEVTTVDPDPERKADYRRLAEAPPTRWACVATPADALAWTANEALQRGSHVLVEKPMATRLDDAEALAAVARKHDLRLAVGYTERHNPATYVLKREIQRVGRVRYIVARRLGPAPGRATLPPLYDLGSHDVDVVHSLGIGLTRTHRTSDDVGGWGFASFDMDNGGRFQVECSHRHHHKVRTLSVEGTAGILVLDYQAQRLTFFAGGMVEELPVQKQEPLVNQWIEFTEHGSSVCTPEQGIRALRSLLA